MTISDSVTHKVVLTRDRKYDISCLSGSPLTVELSKPGNYYIEGIICSHSSTVLFLQPIFKNINVYIKDIYATNSSIVNIRPISEYVLFNKEIVKNRSCILKKRELIEGLVIFYVYT